MTDMSSVYPSGELKEASKIMRSKMRGMNGSARNINGNPVNVQEPFRLLLLPEKDKKQVDEKQVVFWSEKYAKRAKAEREAALMKARDLAENPGNYTRTTSYGAAKYVKK